MSEPGEVDEPTRWLREHTGLDVLGSDAFGDGVAEGDRLLAYVTAGTKRATAGDVPSLLADGDPWPVPGQLWGLLDGRGQPRYVARTVRVDRGRLVEVTPAFAWDEGEHDRTWESWLDGHRAFFQAQGVAEPDDLEVVFERFVLVWPLPDVDEELAPGVREVCHDERDRVAQLHGSDEVVADDRWRVRDLPAVVHVGSDGALDGALTFRPRPDGGVDACTLDVADAADGETVAALLRDALEVVGRRHQDRCADPHLVDGG